MTNSTEWHVTADLWRDYRDGAMDPLLEASLERHVGGCGQCRQDARLLATPDPGTWEQIHVEIARPRLPRPLAWAVRRGLPEDQATLLATSRDLTLSAVTAVGAALTFAILVGILGSRSPFTPDLAFLLLAPLIPMLAVIAAYDATDSLRELTGTMPFSSLRLALLRTGAALAAGIPATFLVGLLIPGIGPATAGWLLPGLALTVAGLVALTWVTARVAAPCLTAAWVVGASLAAQLDALSALTAASGRLVTVAVMVGLFALLVRRSQIQTTFPGAHR